MTSPGMRSAVLRRLTPEEVEGLEREVVSAQTLIQTARIVEAVREEGEVALRRYGERFGELSSGEPLVRDRDDLAQARRDLPREELELLERTAGRIEAFALAQRAALADVDLPVPGGRVGHSVDPVETAGCYAPGGRYPLPSSVLMTAVTARTAGVDEVWVASPNPSPVTLAAAGVAGADGLLAVGGAQAIAALAFAVGGVPRCDVVVGPGNRWVTAAKKLLLGQVGIDMLAGPSELVVLADSTADPEVVAADLLAQAEHDPDALPVLVTTDIGLADRVDAALEEELRTLPTAKVARAALAGGFAAVASDLETALKICDRLAPEHLQVITENAGEVGRRARHYGGLFLGSASAEVLGDYGAGPNHTLPTGSSARFAGGLSVFSFLRARTWIEMEETGGSESLVTDAAALARLEGLEGHARAAELRASARPQQDSGEISGSTPGE